jgi:hypothetical protein
MTSRLVHAAALGGLLLAGTARAQEGAPGWELEASLAAEYAGGHTTYEIADSDGTSSIRSLLRYPIQVGLVGVRGQLRTPALSDGTRWMLAVSALHSGRAGGGTMQDSDWLVGPVETAPRPNGLGLAAHDGKDIYSTSTAELTAFVIDARVAWQHALLPQLRLSPMIGYRYQSLSYGMYDLHQVGYGSYAPGFTADVSGQVLAYDVAWKAPYAGARLELADGPFAGAFEAWGTFLASARDHDDHLLRGKISESDATGTAWQLRAEGRWEFVPRWALTVHGSLTGLSATGTQVQTDSSGSQATIHARLWSSQWAAGLACGVRL